MALKYAVNGLSHGELGFSLGDMKVLAGFLSPIVSCSRFRARHSLTEENVLKTKSIPRMKLDSRYNCFEMRPWVGMELRLRIRL